jgi:hypothetical protein
VPLAKTIKGIRGELKQTIKACWGSTKGNLDKAIRQCNKENRTWFIEEQVESNVIRVQVEKSTKDNNKLKEKGK